jgi:hypothetical protein
MIRMTTSRIRRAIGVTSLTASLVVSMGAVASFADQPPEEPFDVREFETDPQLWPGNPECSFFTGDGETTFTQITRFDPIGGGHEVEDTLPAQDGITVTVVDVKDGGELLEFDWSSTSENVSMVIVKAGDDANLYVYNPPSDGDEGLLTVAGHGVSHISFCAGDITDEPDDPEPQIAPAASAAGSCEAGVTVSLDNTGTDDDDDENTYTTTYTVVVTVNGTEVHNDTHDVDEGDTAQVGPFELGDTDSETWSVTVSSDDLEDDIVAGGTEDCAEEIIETNPAPAAAFNHVCNTDGTGVVTVTLGNTGDADAVFTIVTETGQRTQSASTANNVTVKPGNTAVESVPLAANEVLNFLVTSGEGQWTYEADNDLCATEVQGVVLENDPPTPNGAVDPAPEPQVQGEQLAATGFESPDLLLLAMLFAGLGLALLLSTTKPDPLVVRTH